MCLIGHNKLAGSTEAVQQQVGTVITDIHQHVLGLSSVEVLAKQIATYWFQEGTYAVVTSQTLTAGVTDLV